MKVENNTEWKNQSSSGAVVRCSSEGEFLYPSPWPQVDVENTFFLIGYYNEIGF